MQRKRSENWLAEDKRLLTDLIKERVEVIENKNTDTNTNVKKVAAWADLCTSFNLMTGRNRTVSQLKSLWGMIKMAKKKEMSQERKHLFLTGGGPPPLVNPLNDDDINVWLPNEFTIDTNEFDSDQVNQIKLWGPPLQKKTKIEVPKTNKEEKIQVVQEVTKPGLSDQNNQTFTPMPFQIVDDEESEIVQNSVEEMTEEIGAIQDTPKKVTSKYKSKSKPSVPRRKLLKQPVKKKESEDKTYYMALIAETEVECRKELHALQMDNEEKKSKNLDQKRKNLDLKKMLILKKIEYYERQIFQNK